MVVEPGNPTSLSFGGQSAHLPAIKILHHDKFLAPPEAGYQDPAQCCRRVTATAAFWLPAF
jgi:hypothetical protein